MKLSDRGFCLKFYVGGKASVRVNTVLQKIPPENTQSSLSGSDHDTMICGLAARHFSLTVLHKWQKDTIEALSDKHITGCNKILQHQFPDMPSPQSCLLSQKPEQPKPAEEKSVFFHHYNQHWTVSQLRDDTVNLNATQGHILTAP